MKRLFAAASLMALAAPVALHAQDAAPAAAAVGPQLGTFGVDEAGMDKSVLPGDDFNAFVNGGWEARTAIPADKAMYGNFYLLRDLSDERTRTLLETMPATSKPAMLYRAMMDEAALDRLGATPLRPELAAIARLRTHADVARAFGEGLRGKGASGPIAIGVNQDVRNNGSYAVYAVQSGLGLPDRDYYLADNPKFAAVRERYVDYIAQMLTLAGQRDPKGAAQRIFALEKAIAQTHWTRAESRNLDRTYNPVMTADLATAMPGMDWRAFLTGANLADQSRLIVRQNSAVKAIAAMVPTVPVATWRDYLAYRTIAGAAPMLSKPFVDAHFAFNGTVLSGTTQNRPRWQRAVSAVNGALGEEVGRAYVARHFTPEAKAQMDELVKNVVAAFDQRLQNLTWMAPETKAKSRAKLAAFTPKIGYPSTWRDYSALTIAPGQVYANMRRAQAFEYARNRAKIGKPIDRAEWFMTPQTVNAYANPPMNEIVFPAAILQPPFFDPKADPAVNYGAIGVVIGHEISHHFDDQGRKFDATGNQRDWWTAEDAKRFDALTEQVVAQYGAYEPLPGMKVNGRLTLGENIADLAGVMVAHDAYRLSLKGQAAPVINGYSGDQRFFMGFAQVWRSKAREAALRNQLTTDPHTPGNWRPTVVRNVDAWYDAFDVKPGQKLYLPAEQRIRVW